MPARKKILRVSTIPLSLRTFCMELMMEMSDEYDVVAVSSPGDELDDIAARGIRTVAVKMKRKISPLNDIRSLMRLVRVIHREKPDMVHSITPKAGLLAMAAAWIARVPVRLHTFTGLVFPTSTGMKRSILKTTDRLTCAFATHIHPEGEGVRADLMREQITTKPMRVLGHGNIKGIDLEEFYPNPATDADCRRLHRELRIPLNAIVFTYVGRMAGDKGINELVSAFDTLSKTHPRAWLLMVGVDDEDDRVSDTTIDTVDNNHRIVYIPRWVSDVRPYLTMSTAFVLASYREGFPNSVLEAGAMGKPSIVTDINGSREIITDGYNGHVIQPRDTAALVKAMELYCDDPGISAQLGANAKANIEEKFSAPYVRACLREYYREILG